MKIVVKISGAQLVDPSARAEFAAAVAHATAAGHSIVVVHGGGEQIGALTDRLGLGAPQRVRGLRVTDEETANAALMVLGGSVNRRLVAAIQQAGTNAIGLTGADGGLFAARPVPELGFVGTVDHVDPTMLRTLTAVQLVPVIASVAPPSRAHKADADTFYNVNADHVVAPLAYAFGADAVLFLTQAGGVLDGNGDTMPRLTPSAAALQVQRGVIAQGMIPKVEAAVETAIRCSGADVRIVPAAGKNAILDGLVEGTGTVVATAETVRHG